MAQTWGDPKADTFQKKHIRESHAAGAEARVNAQIVSITARLIEGLSDAHIDIPDVVVSYDPAGTEAQRAGLALHLPIPVPPAPEVQELVQRWGFDGFVVEGSPLIELRFTGTSADAARLDAEAVAQRLDVLESDDVSGPTPTRWPGHRDLVRGDYGQDVQFLRLLFNVGNVDAPVDDVLLAAVRRFKARRGAPVSGLIDADFWRRVFPQKRPQVGQGDSGFVVRVLQAALAVYDSASTPVSGTWGVRTSRDVTDLQKEYNLRVASIVRAPEWAVLIGPEHPSLQEARDRAKGVGVAAVEEQVETPAPTGGRIGGFPTTSRFGGTLGLTAAEPKTPTPVPEKPAPKRRTPRSAPSKAKAT